MLTPRRRSDAGLSIRQQRGRERGRSFATVALFVALAGPSVGGVVACETSCSVDADPVHEIVEVGTTDLEGGTYETAAWDGTYLRFPPKKRYEFPHGLGERPRLVATYVSFSPEPFASGGFGNVAESAGNIVILEGVTAEHILVRNDTCETFYLRVFASHPEVGDASGGESGSAASAGGTSSD